MCSDINVNSWKLLRIGIILL